MARSTLGDGDLPCGSIRRWYLIFGQTLEVIQRFLFERRHPNIEIAGDVSPDAGGGMRFVIEMEHTDDPCSGPATAWAVFRKEDTMLTRFLIRSGIAAVAWLLAVPTPGRAQLGASVPNWPAPPYDQASSTVRGSMHTLGDVTNPIAFVGVAPCRVVDTRG